MTSDAFFGGNLRRFDVVFVDGAHTEEQAFRDIVNALRSLKPSGIVIVHDCNPPTAAHQSESAPPDGPWNGTVWKAWMKCRCSGMDAGMLVVDTDWGVGVIDPAGRQEPFRCQEDIFDYEVFARHRKAALNLMSEDEWFATVGTAPRKALA